MKRRRFMKTIGFGAAAATVAPHVSLVGAEQKPEAGPARGQDHRRSQPVAKNRPADQGPVDVQVADH